MEYYITQPKDYWISSTAVHITLNALGDANRIQGSVATGAVIMCFIDSIRAESEGGESGNGEGLWYGSNHEPKKWPLMLSPTFFNSDTRKYVYAAIPRSSTVGTQAVVVFPSEPLDIYGRASRDNGTSYEQVGSEDYFYVYLQGIISAVDNGARSWERSITDWGSLDTTQGLEEKISGGDWYSYDSLSQVVTFLKDIVMQAGTTFLNLILNNKTLDDVATSDETQPVDSNTAVATPNYVEKFYLSKVTTSQQSVAGSVNFDAGLTTGSGAHGFNENGDVTARTLKATGTNGETTTDGSVAKNLGLQVTESGTIGGILRVAKSILTKTIQSLNFSGGDSFFGTGWQLTDDAGNGRSRLVVDDLFVRGKFSANAMEVRKLLSIGGNFVISPAASQIEEVDYFKRSYVDGEFIAVEGAELVDGEYTIRAYTVRSAIIAMSADDSLEATSQNGGTLYITSGTTVIASGSGSITFAPGDNVSVNIYSDSGGDTITYRHHNGYALLGYEYISVPWVLRLIPLALANKILSRKKWVRSTMSESDWAQVAFYRCWLKADDGSTQTINTWQTGMLARCQTFDTSQINGGTHSGSYEKPADSPATYNSVTNKLYWRAVIATATGVNKNNYGYQTAVLNDEKNHNYIDLSNETLNGVQLYFTGSDHCAAGDHIVCFGDWLDNTQANIVTIETVGSDAPAIKQYDNVGYTDGTSINWSLDNLIKTRISPKAGNRFIAPEFIVQVFDENGNITSQNSIAEFIVDTNGIMATVQGQIADGKNLFAGSLTGSGWKSGGAEENVFNDIDAGTNTTYNTDNWLTIKAEGDTFLRSPLVTLKKGTKYAFSFDAPATSDTFEAVAIALRTAGGESLGSWQTSSGALRRTASYDHGTHDDTTAYFYIIAATIHHPQMEIGIAATNFAATAFEAGGDEISSAIKMTADKITLQVKNNLETIGININGNASVIDLQAATIQFKNPAAPASPNTWIDTANGTLHTKNGVFSGSIATPYTVITSENINDYITRWWSMGSYSAAFLDFGNVGYNVQFNYFPYPSGISVSYNVSLPYETDETLLGCEIKILNMTGSTMLVLKYRKTTDSQGNEAVVIDNFQIPHGYEFVFKMVDFSGVWGSHEIYNREIEDYVRTNYYWVCISQNNVLANSGDNS